MTPRRKWAWALGTTSRAPRGRHYVLLDVDRRGTLPWTVLGVLCRARRAVVVRTPHGWHVYTDWAVSWATWVRLVTLAGADPAWVRIARRRGYAFLRDREYVPLPWPVERMRIRWGRT